ncbi:MAG: shikimate dehydrogenase [Defluviitaleaceae bacterium]|nr:shikimate dehydrogenase [Defluviitaleaceae bacterium]
MVEINGKTELYGLIGSPVEHSLSPFIHNFFAKHTGKNIAYTAFSVEQNDLKYAIKGAYCLGIKGLNITMPYKQDIIPLLNETDEAAKRLSSVNTIKYVNNGYMGYNTDIYGFAKTLEKHGIDIYGERVVILGAGGSAASAAFASAELGASEIIIINKTSVNANKLAVRIKKHYNISVRCENFEEFFKIMHNKEALILVQTTPVGFSELKEKSPVMDMRIFEYVKYAIDFIYSPYETVFLKMAKNAGCVSINGIDILIFQAAAAYEIWTGEKISCKCTEYLSMKIKTCIQN